MNMEKISKLFLLLSLVGLFTACDKLTGDDGGKEDPAFAESMTGLWYVDFVNAVVVDLRPDGTAVSSTYFIGGIPGPTTSYIPSWKATETSVGPFRRSGNELSYQVTTGEFIEPERIYDPATDHSTVRLSKITDEIWTGYFENKIITLEFLEDGTARRMDKPNAGWDGEEEKWEYRWETTGRVSHLDGDEAWCVGLPYEMPFSASKEIKMIFVDFGDAASAFVNFVGTVDDL